MVVVLVVLRVVLATKKLFLVTASEARIKAKRSSRTWEVHAQHPIAERHGLRGPAEGVHQAGLTADKAATGSRQSREDSASPSHREVLALGLDGGRRDQVWLD